MIPRDRHLELAAQAAIAAAADSDELLHENHPKVLREAEIANGINRPNRRSTIAALPDPAEYAWDMPFVLAEMLLDTVGDGGAARARAPHVFELGRHGLADIRTGFLTNFGLAVRSALRKELP